MADTPFTLYVIEPAPPTAKKLKLPLAPLHGALVTAVDEKLIAEGCEIVNTVDDVQLFASVATTV